MSYLLLGLTKICNKSLINVRNVYKGLILKNQSNINVNTNVVKDVILYKYDNSRFFKILNIFGLAQFTFWGYISYFSFFDLKNVPVDAETKEDLPWWRKINLGEDKYRYTFGILSFCIGYGILLISWSYTLKSIRYLILRKGGKEVTLVTYTPFGENRILTVGLENVSAKSARSQSTSQLPLKVRNYYLHYVMDMRGEFKNPALFDYTAGIKRTWRT